MIKLKKIIKESALGTSTGEAPKDGNHGNTTKFSTDAKRHFLEIVSTYNKYQEMMDRKSDIIEVAETLGGIIEAAKQLAINEEDDWFDKHTVKRNMGELTKLGTQFEKVTKEAKLLDQRMSGLYEDMGHILSRYYKIGEITEDEMKSRLGMRNESKINEAFTPKDIAMIKKVVDKEKKLIGLSPIFKKMGWHTDFVMMDSVPPHLKLKKNKNDKQTYLLVNKKYVDKPDWVSGEIAGGLDESKKSECDTCGK